MPTLDDVRTIALGFPETMERVDGHRHGATWRTKSGVFVWERGPSGVDLEALEKIGRQWPTGPVIGVRTDGLDAKEAMLAGFPEVFFTIPHFEGYPAVLVRLEKIEPDLLREIITDAWILKAPKRLATTWLADNA